MKTKTKFTLIVGMMMVLLSCGKYEEGPFFSIRTKNARLEGEWKLVKQDRKSTSDVFTSVYTFENGIMTENFDGFISTYSYSESWEITIKDNHIKIVTNDDGSVSDYTTYWNWENGASSKELINIDGDTYRILKLTNKEMILEQNYSSTPGSTVTNQLTFEKQ
jgi:hypothetical protein